MRGSHLRPLERFKPKGGPLPLQTSNLGYPGVCIVGDLDPPPGGVATYCRNLAGELAGQGWPITLVDTAGGGPKTAPPGVEAMIAAAIRANALRSLDPRGWPLHRAVRQETTGLSLRDRIRFAGLATRLQGVLGEYAPGLVHSNHAGIRSLAALAAARQAKLPLVVTIHGAHFTSPALAPHLPLARRLCAAARAVIANSRFTAEAARDCGVDVPIDVIPLGVDTARYHPGPVDQAWLARQGLAPGRRRVLFAGWISHNKGPDLLLAAAERLGPDQRQDVELIFVGPDRGYLTTLRERAARSAFPVRIITAPTPEDYPLFYRSADIFVLPTRGFEGFGLVALEALASGCAVVGARLGGIPEAMGPAGLPFPPGDAGALAKQLGRLLGDPAELAAVRARGPAEAAARTWATVGAATAEVYRRVLGMGEAEV